MTRVFPHGGLRLVLLASLEDGPKHGYELILALEERFMGMYRPSSGTVYPRLAALEEEGLITGRDSDGKRIYELTEAGRTELARRRAELDETVVSATSAVRSVVDDLQSQIRAAVVTVHDEVGRAVADVRRQAADTVETVTAPESPARQAARAGEHARRVAVEEAKRVKRAADELRRQVERETRAGAGGRRDELDDLFADVAGWTAELVEEVRRRLPDETQRARVRDALDAARRAFSETLRS